MSLFNPKEHFLALREMAALLTKHRQLTWAMTKREIGERYAGQVLGTLWVVGHPLILMAIYVVIFGYVFRQRFGGTVKMPLDFTAFLLSGLIPWLALMDAMNKSATSITSNAELVKQVVFPIEVLPLKTVIVSVMSLAISFIALVLYVVIVKKMLLWTYALLPVLMFFQALGMIGLAYIFSAVGTYFRDVKDILQVFFVAGIYVLPIVYVPGNMPKIFEQALKFNPFSYMIWCYQDVCFYGRFEHPWAWVIFIGLSLIVFHIGFCTFRHLKTVFGNVL